MITILATNIAVLAYISSEVEFASDLSIPLTIGAIGKSFNYLAHLARTLTTITMAVPNFNLTNHKDSFKTEIEILKQTHFYILNNLTD